MNKAIFFSIILLAVSIVGQAQVKIGTRVGLSTFNLTQETIEEKTLRVALREANYGLHFGFFIRGHLSKRIYLQPELLFNSNAVNYEVEDKNVGIFKRILGEKYQYLDMPLIVGYKLGPLHIEGGPVGHAYLASKTELDVLEAYEQRLNNFHVGYQAGIGLDILRLILDVRFEGNFRDYDGAVHIGNQQIKFSNNSTRWILTLGYTF